MAYMAKVPDATQTSVTGLGWFKIQEDGFDGSKWGVDRLYAAKGLQTFKIPSCIPPGNYFLRAEISKARLLDGRGCFVLMEIPSAVALHPASSYPGAQFYVSACSSERRLSRS